MEALGAACGATHTCAPSVVITLQGGGTQTVAVLQGVLRVGVAAVECEPGWRHNCEPWLLTRECCITACDFLQMSVLLVRTAMGHVALLQPVHFFGGEHIFTAEQGQGMSGERGGEGHGRDRRCERVREEGRRSHHTIRRLPIRLISCPGSAE